MTFWRLNYLLFPSFRHISISSQENQETIYGDQRYAFWMFFISLSLHGGKVYELTKIQFVEAPVTWYYEEEKWFMSPSVIL